MSIKNGKAFLREYGKRILWVTAIVALGSTALSVMTAVLNSAGAPTPICYLGTLMVLAGTFGAAHHKDMFEEALFCSGAFGWMIFIGASALGIVN